MQPIPTGLLSTKAEKEKRHRCGEKAALGLPAECDQVEGLRGQPDGKEVSGLGTGWLETGEVKVVEASHLGVRK